MISATGAATYQAVVFYSRDRNARRVWSAQHLSCSMLHSVSAANIQSTSSTRAICRHTKSAPANDIVSALNSNDSRRQSYFSVTLQNKIAPRSPFRYSTWYSQACYTACNNEMFRKKAGGEPYKKERLVSSLSRFHAPQITLICGTSRPPIASNLA